MNRVAGLIAVGLSFVGVGAACSQDADPLAETRRERQVDPASPNALETSDRDNTEVVGSPTDTPTSTGSSSDSRAVSADADSSTTSTTSRLDDDMTDTSTITTRPVEQTWAVVLAGSSQPRDQILEAAIADAALAGYEATPTNCDLGASDALGMASRGSYTVSVYFNTEKEADAAVIDLAALSIIGVVVNVQMSCPD